MAKNWQRANEELQPKLQPGVKLLRTLEGHQAAVFRLAFDPRGDTLASGSADNTVKLWEVRSGKLLRTLEGHQGAVNGVAFDPQGDTLASGSDDGTVKLWEARSGELLHTLEEHRSPVWSVAFDPQGGTLASGSDDVTVKLWEVRSGKLLRTLEGHQGAVNSVAFDPQGGTLASGSNDETVKLWEARSGKLLHTLTGHKDWVWSVAFDPEGGTLASGSDDDTVELWEVASGKLLRTLEGHTGDVENVTFSPDGSLLASKSHDQTIRLWNCETWETVAVIPAPTNTAGWIPASLTFHPSLPLLAAAGSEPDTPNDERCRLIHLWELDYDVLLGRLKKAVYYQSARVIIAGDSGIGKTSLAMCLSESLFPGTRPTDGRRGWLFSSNELDGIRREILLWELTQRDNSGGYTDTAVVLVVVDAALASAAIKAAQRLSTLVGKIGGRRRLPKFLVLTRSDLAEDVASSADLEKLCHECGFIGFFLTSAMTGFGIPNLARAITRAISWDDLPIVVTTEKLDLIRDFLVSELRRGTEFYFDDLDELRAQAAARVREDVSKEELLTVLSRVEVLGLTTTSRPYTSAKIVLVGDHSVGKSALGYRLIHGVFKEQASTHGQQFWVFPALGKRRADGTDCEAILWDFAGQPDYRLVHALFVDNADLALVLFDASDLRDPLHGVGFWLKQLQTEQSACPIILVAAQTDRGSSTLTPEELTAFCQRHGIVGPIATSALTGLGFAELVERMKSLIPWEDKAATVTTTTFKRIKDYVLGLKEAESDGQIIVTPEELRSRLEATDADWSFTDAEMLTAVGHLENYGYVKRLRTSKGEQRVLLQPERLNNLASSFVLEARRNPKGLGTLEEKRLLTGGYDFPELKDLHEGERDVLLDSAALLFLEHNVCFRETDPLRMEPYLVFPELINLKKPPEEEAAIEDGVAYTVSGPTENVFASLVVLLGYTHTFTRTAQWQNNARYEMGDGWVCGFRQEAARDGELDFVLCFGPTVSLPVRTLFQGLFESFLARRNVTVRRFEPVRCKQCGHLLDRSVVRQRLKEGKTFAFCNDCGEKLALPAMAEPIQLTREEQAAVELQRRAAEQRTRFEQAVFRVRTYVAEQKITPLETFISYAWGVPDHERWVERQLATDLQKAGIDVVLDRWENSRIGSSILRFVERIEDCGHVIVVGTPLYRQKAKNVASAKGSVVAAEWDLAGIRLLATEDQKRTVLPVLLAGEESEAFPALLRGRVYGDFRKEDAYFANAFDLILDVYDIPHRDPAVADLRESLRWPEMR